MRLSLMTFMYEIPLLMSGPWNSRKEASLEELLQIAAETGFTGVDLTWQTISNVGMERILTLLEKLHLDLTSIICFDHLADPALSDKKAMASYEDMIREAGFLRCDHVMLIPGKTDPSTDPDLLRETMIRRFSSLVQLASEEGVQCMIEDDPDLTVRMCTEADIKAFLDAVPGLHLVYDTANMMVAGEDPVSFYEALHDSVIHMHIKDIALCDDPSRYRDEGLNGVFYASAPHGTGMVDFEKLFHSFGKYDYQGILSLEYVPSELGIPSGNVLRADLQKIYRKFAALACKYMIGVNEVPLLSKLIPFPEKEVWKEIKRRGIHAVEICILPEMSDRLKAYEEEVSKRYHNPRRFACGEEIDRLVSGIRASGLEVYSAHLMLSEAWPELILESVPYLENISSSTGIRQFVVSCSLETAETVRQYLPCLQAAAASLKEEGIVLCYHNHHQDCLPLDNGKSAFEMILEECPDIMLQLDVGWAWYGHMDSLAFMKAHGDRIASVHLKDLASDARERTDPGRFQAIGSGSVPIRDVLDHLEWCRLTPGKLIIDQDASAGDMYEDLSSGVAFVQDVTKNS